MDVQFRKRKTGKDNARRTRELYGNHSAKHVRIQEQCQENHLKNIQQNRIDDSTNESHKGKSGGKNNSRKRNGKSKSTKSKKESK